MRNLFINKIGGLVFHLKQKRYSFYFLAGFLIAAITGSGIVILAFPSILNIFLVLIGFTLSPIPLLICAWLANLYEQKNEPQKYVKQATQIASILRQRGSLPIPGIIYFTPKSLKTSLTHNVIVETIYENNDLEMNESTGIVSLRSDVGSANKETIPLPPKADYVAGYYQMYNRMQLMRNNPELADMPLDMVDNLYATDDQDTQYHLTSQELQLS
jgi:hypothetical protein